MKNLKLESDEGIIQQTTDVERYQANDEYTEIYEMYLTNKSLILVYEKSTGLLKTEDVVERISLDDIRIVKGKVQIFKVDDDDYGMGMQIIFKNGSREHFVFEKEKEIQSWINSIIELLTEEENNSNIKDVDNEEINANDTEDIVVEETDVDDTKVNVDSSSIIFSNLKGVMDSAKGMVKNIKNQITNEDLKEEIQKNDIKLKKEKNNDIVEEKSNKQKEEKFLYCSSCGEKLKSNSKFCNSCGTPTNDVQQSKKDLKEETLEKEKTDDEETKKETIKEEHIIERKSVYDGYIHKCPSCGETLKSFVSNCPACGYELRSSKANSSVSELASKLEKIESKRENSKIGLFNNANVVISKTDEQKISLIRSFPIPNTKEDLYEFLVLSKANISTDIFNQYGNTKREVSNAWKAKFEQAYQKSKIIFKDDPKMSEIQAMYDDTNKKIHKSETFIWKMLGVSFGSTFVILIITFIIVIVVNIIGGKTPTMEETENAKLDSIVNEIKTSLENEDYKLASLNAESLDCEKDFSNDEIKRKCEVQKEYWIDKITNEETLNKDKTEEQKKDNSTFQVDKKEIEEFTKGFEKAEFSKYNSPAEENGLGGTKIYIKGHLEKTEILETGEYTGILGFIKDDNGNKWVITLNTLPFVTESHYNSAVKKEIVCNVVFEGFSEKYKMPHTSLNEMLVLENGTKLDGIQKIIRE